MLIAKISESHREQLDAQEEEFCAEIQRREDSERILRDRVQELSTQNASQGKQLAEKSTLITQLQTEIFRNQKVHEEEVQLRLEFESKLNGLHSLQRDLEERYERAVRDIQT